MSYRNPLHGLDSAARRTPLSELAFTPDDTGIELPIPQQAPLPTVRAVRSLRILVTGTRGDKDGELTPTQISLVQAKLFLAAQDALTAGRPVVIVHGACHLGGVDRVAAQWAQRTPGADHEPHPAQWKGGRGAGPRRNGEMVALGAVVCLAFPGPDSTGTWDCLKQATRAGIPGRVYPLNGEVKS